MFYYKSKKNDEPLISKLEELALSKPTRGFDDYYGRIRNEGLNGTISVFGEFIG